MSTKCICNDDNLTDAEKWSTLVGTDYVGNLPQYKRNDHEGHCWRPCPYSTDVSDSLTRIMLGLSDSDPLPTKVSHTSGGRDYYMATAHQGVWGFRCTYDNCPHLLDTGSRYFYR